VFQKLDKYEAAPIWSMHGRTSAGRLAFYDPGNQYGPSTTCGAPPASATHVKKMQEVLGPTDTDRQLGRACLPAGRSRQVQGLCGIHMLDSVDDIVPADVAFSLGLLRSEISTQPKDLDKAADLIGKIRYLGEEIPFVGIISTRSPSGEICFVVGWSGDIKQAQKRAAEARNGVEIGYAIPPRRAPRCFSTNSGRSQGIAATSPRRMS